AAIKKPNSTTNGDGGAKPQSKSPTQPRMDSNQHEFSGTDEPLQAKQWRQQDSRRKVLLCTSGTWILPARLRAAPKAVFTRVHPWLPFCVHLVRFRAGIVACTRTR